MKLVSHGTTIKPEHDEYDNLKSFLNDLSDLSSLNCQVYEYLGRLLFIAYRHCLFIDNFSIDMGNVYVILNNGESGEFYRYVRLEISL